MIDLLVTNIKELVTVDDHGRPFKTGPEMRDLGIVPDGAVAMDGGKILWAGPSGNLPAAHREAKRTLDAEGMVALPGLVDSHTHLVFAGSREGEFEQRCLGDSYAEIAARGGGILSTVRAVRAASVDDLVRLARPRLARMLAAGTRM